MEFYDMTYLHGYASTEFGKKKRDVNAVVTCNQVIIFVLEPVRTGQVQKDLI